MENLFIFLNSTKKQSQSRQILICLSFHKKSSKPIKNERNSVDCYNEFYLFCFVTIFVILANKSLLWKVVFLSFRTEWEILYYLILIRFLVVLLLEMTNFKFLEWTQIWVIQSWQNIFHTVSFATPVSFEPLLKNWFLWFFALCYLLLNSNFFLFFGIFLANSY